MKTKLFLALAVAVLLGNSESHAQQLRSSTPVADDYILLLQNYGFELFKFDISSFAEDTYNVTFVIKEYKDNVEVESGGFDIIISNRVMLSEFSIEEQQRVKDCNMEIDAPEDGVFRLSKDLSIGFVPSPCDSLRFLSLALSRTGEARMPLKRYPICKPDGTAEYSYTTRPFTINTFQLGEFIPLVLYGSFWWDNDAGCTRCCGESVIAPDFSSEILKYIPHYYIIGVEINSPIQ